MKGERCLRELVAGKRDGVRDHLVWGVLSVAAVGYAALLRARACAYQIGMLRSYRLPVPVISVGNITVGGTGKTSVRQLMALIKRCNFFITNDSGPMHIAAAFDVPLVAIFGPTDHRTTSAFFDKGVIVRESTDCAPCMLRECPTDHRCMTAVTAGDVIEAADKLYREVVKGER